MSNPFRVEMSGPLSVFAPGFVEHLVEQGYRPDPAAKQLRLMAHLSRWLAERDLVGRNLTSARVEQFLRSEARVTERTSSRRGDQAAVDYLRGLGVVPAPAPVVPHTPDEQLSTGTRRICCADEVS